MIGKQADPASISPTEDKALRLVISRALDASNTRGRTGIAAAIVSGDKILEIGENEVNALSDPTKHAEMVAIAGVTQRMEHKQLAGCTLISSLQPCEMCLSAMRFAGIERVIFAARQEKVSKKYFVFPHLQIADFQNAGTHFQVVGGVYEDDVIHLYADGRE